MYCKRKKRRKSYQKLANPKKSEAQKENKQNQTNDNKYSKVTKTDTILQKQELYTNAHFSEREGKEETNRTQVQTETNLLIAGIITKCKTSLIERENWKESFKNTI